MLLLSDSFGGGGVSPRRRDLIGHQMPTNHQATLQIPRTCNECDPGSMVRLEHADLVSTNHIHTVDLVAIDDDSRIDEYDITWPYVLQPCEVRDESRIRQRNMPGEYSVAGLPW